ncbi:MAG: LutB/LldF family L-lactate oxidation iron-sulfur protein [Sphingobium sp.]
MSAAHGAAAPPFGERVHEALANQTLQRALGKFQTHFIALREAAVEQLPEFEAIRDEARTMKDHALAHIDLYIESYERKVTEAGGHVHFAGDAADARALVLDICRRVGARAVTKGKSMISEEIGLNAFLQEQGIETVETDLGEYIIQLRDETPSHIVAPAIHVSKEQIAEDFREAHRHLSPDRDLSEPRSLLSEARGVLREKFLTADVGITGANFLVAETGSSIIVTNEGNGDLTQTLPRVHIVVASFEKIVPTLNDAMQLVRLLPRSANGQEMTVYTSISTGPRRAEDPDGPEEYHVILLDNGRSAMLGTDFQEALRCIRCGACMNHCPVYQAVGGHAYASVYPGPIGAVMAPIVHGLEGSRDLPNASTFCGRCESVCPMQIPLPRLMRHWREEEFSRHLSPARQRWALRLWAALARRPRLYQLVMGVAARMGGLIGRKGRFSRLPGASGWCDWRDLAAPEGESFQSRWARGGSA